jgi:hypothetical protein
MNRLWLALAVALVCGACSFRGGDFAPMAKEPETACSKQAEAFCKEHLGSENLAACVKREKYRCELLQQDDPNKAPQP